MIPVSLTIDIKSQVAFNHGCIGGESVYIDRLELQGFKSFARRTTVQLGPGFQALSG